MANCPVVSFQQRKTTSIFNCFHPEKSRTTTTTSSSSSNARMIHVEQNRNPKTVAEVSWESAFALAEYLRKTVFEEEEEEEEKDATKTTLLEIASTSAWH